MAFQQLCSRPGLPAVEATWTPSEDTLALMERRFGRLKRLRAEGCCMIGASIGDVNDFYRQYVGVVVRGRQYVYINAFPIDADLKLGSEPVKNICDGGSGFWGVLYDVDSGSFIDLAFNGVA